VSVQVIGKQDGMHKLKSLHAYTLYHKDGIGHSCWLERVYFHTSEVLYTWWHAEVDWQRSSLEK